MSGKATAGAKMTRFVGIALACTLPVLGGCAEFDSIHRRVALPRIGTGPAGQIVTVDAKQRHLLVLPETDPAAGSTQWRVCAEAAPDVFSAYAASLAARGDRSGGEASFGSAETAASIERTQTVNAIRESFYRTCERFASGAINRTLFVIQAARDQRAMVGLLAIEQLTGAVRPRATVIAGASTAATALSGGAAADLVKDANTRLQAAEAARDEAQSAVTAAEADGKVCGTTDGQDADSCNVLKARLGATKQAVETAETGMQDAVKLAKDVIAAASATTGTGSSFQGGGVSLAEIDKAAMSAVADAVVKIAVGSTINESLMFCIGYLSNPQGEFILRASTFDNDSQQRIVQGCMTMLEEQQRGDAVRSDALLSGLVLAPTRGEQEGILARYLAPELPSAELERRMALTRQAAKAIELDSSRVAIMRVLIVGPEGDRRKLVDELRKIEANQIGRAALE